MDVGQCEVNDTQKYHWPFQNISYEKMSFVVPFFFKTSKNMRN